MDDLRTIYHMLLAPVRGNSHAERLESFYRAQAAGYDQFRKRLLHGREVLFAAIPGAPGERWVDIGAGTGASLDFMGARAADFDEIHLVDLSPSLLAVAARRVEERALTNVTLHEADATAFSLDSGSVDLVTFSYSLTMIPDWFAALENARRLLRPGGRIAVVDFYVSRKHVSLGAHRHNAFTRHFWPFWFAHDNVFLSPDHLPWLRAHFDEEYGKEGADSLPYVPFARVPNYQFVGRAPEGEARSSRRADAC